MRSIQPLFQPRVATAWAIALTLGGLAACGGKGFGLATTASGGSSGASVAGSGSASASGTGSGLASSGSNGSPSGSSAPASAGADGGVSSGSALTDGGPGDASSSCDSAVCSAGAGIEGGDEAGGEAGRACAPIVHTGSVAVTYQMDPGHTGNQPGDALTVPLCKRWAYKADGLVSYPIVASGRVFVTSGWDPNTSSAAAAKVVALDELTGNVLWGPLTIPGTYGYGAAAYAGGKVFVINFDGRLRALDEATGTTVWDVQLPNQYIFTSPPTAVGGTVFVGGAGSGGTLYAVGADKGAVLWTQPVANGDQSSPAVSSAGVFASYACNQAYGFGLGGIPLWHFAGPCQGGGGKTVALSGGRLFTRDATEGDLVLYAADGTLAGKYASSFIPALSESSMFTTESGVLRARPVGQWSDASSAGVWTFGTVAEPVVIAPIVVGTRVVTGTALRVVVLDSSDGTLVSSAPLAGISTPDEQNVRALAGLVEADGLLLVPAGSRLVAY